MNESLSTPNIIGAVPEKKIVHSPFVSFRPLAGTPFAATKIYRGWRVEYFEFDGQTRLACVFGSIRRRVPVKNQSIVIPLSLANPPTVVRDYVVDGSVVRAPNGSLEIVGARTDRAYIEVVTGFRLNEGGPKAHMLRLQSSGIVLAPHRSFALQPRDTGTFGDVEIDAEGSVLEPAELLAEISVSRELPGLGCFAHTISLYDAPPSAGLLVQQIDNRRFRVIHDGEATTLRDAIGPSHAEDWLDLWGQYKGNMQAARREKDQRRRALLAAVPRPQTPEEAGLE